MANKISTWFNNIVTKIGLDRVAHFGVYGLVVGAAAAFGWFPALMAFVAMWILSVVKEMIGNHDKWDIVAGVVGGIIPLLCALLKFFIL